MEAKDTVMKYEGELSTIAHNASMAFRKKHPLPWANQNLEGGLVKVVYLAMAHAQAGITWKARDSEVEASYKAGIREVVEEYTAIRACTHMTGYHTLIDCKECEQAKLKEWRVKNG